MGQVSNNRFQAICEDMSGFIWIGTENGLNRYDGYNFNKFFHDNNDSLSLMSNYIRSLYSDEDGTLWIGTNRGIQYLRPSEKSFHTVLFPGDRLPYIQQITKLSDGRIWIAAPGDGLYWVDPNNPVQVNGTKVVAKVYSMLGKEMLDFSNSYSSGTLGFGTAGIPQGSYMLSVQVGSEHSVQKVLVK